MSERWSSEAPTEDGFYWAYAPCGDYTVLQIAMHPEAGACAVIRAGDLRPVSQNPTILWRGPIAVPPLPTPTPRSAEREAE